MTAKENNYVRYLDEKSIKAFTTQAPLVRLMDKIKNDPEEKYQLEIRQNCATVYYKGGKLTSLIKSRGSMYRTNFDIKYCENQGKESINKNIIANINKYDIDAFVDNIELYTAEMDAWFLEHPKAERINQQKLCNKFRKPNDIICLLDIEFVINKARFDMLGVDNNGNVKLIELKVGNDAISSKPGTDGKMKSGVFKHYLAFDMVKSKEEYSFAVIKSAENIINARKALGLPTFEGKLNMDINSLKYEIWLADYNTRGKCLGDELINIEKAGGSTDIVKINPKFLSEFKKKYI